MSGLVEISRYLLVGGLVTFADMAVYSVLTGRPRQMARIPANILSVTCGMILGFTLHFALVFQPREPLLAERMVKYILVVGVSVYGVQNLVIYTLAELWRAPVRLAQSLARGVALSCPRIVAQISNLSASAEIVAARATYSGGGPTAEARRTPSERAPCQVSLRSSNLCGLFGFGVWLRLRCGVPYRRLAACRAPANSRALEVRAASRLQIGDTADSKSALPHLDDFIDRMTGKAAAALVGVVWNFIFFKFFDYA